MDKHFGWGIVDKDGKHGPDFGHWPTREMAENVCKRILNPPAGMIVIKEDKLPYRAVELFFKDENE